MPNQTTPTLGYGKQTEASIDAVNMWMRSTPWYQSQMRAWGQDPGHPTLTKSQSQQILRAAQAQGVVVNEGDMEIDDHGNFHPVGHKLRNTLIVAGIAGAALATMGAAGVFSGAALPTASGVGGLSATSTGLPVTAGLGTAGGAVGGAAAATGAGLLPATATAPAIGTLAGGVPSGLVPAATTAGGASVVNKVHNWLTGDTGSSALDTALKYGIPVAGNLIGANIQSTGIKEAEEIRAKSTAEALAFEKQQYGDLVGRLTPYIASGTTSTDRMSQLLGLPARPSTTAAPWPGPEQPPMPPGSPGRTITPEPVPGGRIPLPRDLENLRAQVQDRWGRSPGDPDYGRDPNNPSEAKTAIAITPTPPAAQTVTMRSPDGKSTRAIPINQVDHWKSLGAEVIQ